MRLEQSGLVLCMEVVGYKDIFPTRRGDVLITSWSVGWQVLRHCLTTRPSIRAPRRAVLLLDPFQPDPFQPDPFRLTPVHALPTILFVA